MRLGVVVFPGSCDDRDAAQALALLGAEPVALWHDEADLRGVEAIILPGGFSYGDYLRAGAIARFAPVMRSMAGFAGAGGAVLGVCNGFQVLCEAGLLPGALTRNAGLRFIHRRQHVRIESAIGDLAPGTVLDLPIKHGEGRYVHPDPAVLEAHGQVFVRYCSGDGHVSPDSNPNGSVNAIAGVTNATGSVIGLMPHPEHAVDALLGSTDGARLLRAVLARGSARPAQRLSRR